MNKMKEKTVLAKAEPDAGILFAEEYKKLCEKYKHRISITPVWKPTNHGSFELILDIGIEKLK